MGISLKLFRDEFASIIIHKSTTEQIWFFPLFPDLFILCMQLNENSLFLTYKLL